MSLALELVPETARSSLPRWPQAWYIVSRSEDLRKGSVSSGELAGQPYVLFRTEGGALAALDAHCPHMGAHLQHGEVRGERLRCPLHHWQMDGEGHCWGAGAGPRGRSRTWPVKERFGLIFVYLGQGSPPELPAPPAAEAYNWSAAPPIRLKTDWHSMMVNGFDLLHLGAVHSRALVEPPELSREGGTLVLRYVSRVTGRRPSDRVMKFLSKDRIQVWQACHGPTLAISSRLGNRKTSAVLGLLPDGEGLRAFGAFGIEGGGPLLPLRQRLTRWLFTAFLRRDFEVVEGMRLDLRGVEDPGVRAVAAFLASLPEASRPPGETTP